MKGTQKGNKHITFVRGKHVVIETADGRLPAHADGETISIDANRLEVDCLPNMIDIIVPTTDRES